MMSVKEKELIQRYVDGDLSQTQEQEVLQLLASNPEAQGYARQIKRLESVLSEVSAGVSVPREVEAKVQEAMGRSRSASSTGRASESRRPTRRAWTLAAGAMFASLIFGGVIVYRSHQESAPPAKPLKFAIFLYRTSPGWQWPAIVKEINYSDPVTFHLDGKDTLGDRLTPDEVFEEAELRLVYNATADPEYFGKFGLPTRICNVLVRPHRLDGDSVLVEMHYVFSDIDFRSPSDIRTKKSYVRDVVKMRLLEPSQLVPLRDYFKSSIVEFFFWKASPTAVSREKKAQQYSFVPFDMWTESLAEIANISSGVQVAHISGTWIQTDHVIGKETKSGTFSVTEIDTLYFSSLVPLGIPLQEKVYRLEAAIKPYETESLFIDGLYLVPVEKTPTGVRVRLYQTWRRGPFDSQDPWRHTVEKIRELEIRSGEPFELDLISRTYPPLKEYPLPVRVKLAVSFKAEE